MFVWRDPETIINSFRASPNWSRRIAAQVANGRPALAISLRNCSVFVRWKHSGIQPVLNTADPDFSLRSSQRVVACVIARGQKLFVCQRPAHKRHGGLWEFPGGKAEPNETDEEAARRELREELGVLLVAAHPALFEAIDPDSPYVIAFVPVDIEGEPVSSEHTAMAWGVPTELLAFPLAPSDRSFVEFLVKPAAKGYA